MRWRSCAESKLVSIRSMLSRVKEGGYIYCHYSKYPRHSDHERFPACNNATLDEHWPCKSEDSVDCATGPQCKEVGRIEIGQVARSWPHDEVAYWNADN